MEYLAFNDFPRNLANVCLAKNVSPEIRRCTVPISFEDNSSYVETIFSEEGNPIYLGKLSYFMDSSNKSITITGLEIPDTSRNQVISGLEEAAKLSGVLKVDVIPNKQEEKSWKEAGYQSKPGVMTKGFSYGKI